MNFFVKRCLLFTEIFQYNIQEYKGMSIRLTEYDWFVHLWFWSVFSPETVTVIGRYVRQFNQVGEYYVWSGYVDVWGIKNYVGKIVVNSAQTKVVRVNVQVGNANAIHGKRELFNLVSIAYYKS